MPRRGYLPRDHVAMRHLTQQQIQQPVFGRSRPAHIAAAVHAALLAGLPPGLPELLEDLAPALLSLSLKGLVTIAEEEVSRVLLQVNGKVSMSGFHAARVRHGDDTHYIRVSQLTMDLPELYAIRDRYDRQIDTLQAQRDATDYCITLYEKYPTAPTFGEVLVLANVQYEMVFDEVI